MKQVIIPVIGFTNGIVVGSGIVALLTLLDIIPRLAQLTKTYNNTTNYENCIILGATLAALLSLIDVGVNIGGVTVIVTGFTMGVFIGLLASALAEVMNVLPVVVRRFKIEGYIVYIATALILGKTLGSFLDWILIK